MIVLSHVSKYNILFEITIKIVHYKSTISFFMSIKFCPENNTGVKCDLISTQWLSLSNITPPIKLQHFEHVRHTFSGGVSV